MCEKYSDYVIYANNSANYASEFDCYIQFSAPWRFNNNYPNVESLW
jgi:hypothetical protein